MAFDFKKAYKEFYLPPRAPAVLEVPEMNFLAVRGAGDPNAEGGAYQTAVELLYGLAYTIRMSEKAGHDIGGFFEYVVPPLEGFWWQEGVHGVDYVHKETFEWISVIRLPDFVTRADFDWAVGAAAKKKKYDFSKVQFWTHREGLCVQCMHIGPYDEEPATVAAMDAYALQNGYALDFSDIRRHHEIYLTDPRKGDTASQKTVLRHPVRPV
ncbi:MAG TPA: GyrI-like domain-containing protein [Candidatus Acidoferrum sp.]|nr:GyrI-like domain-containing protein [Candidatus Acidoferrum sp.]